MDKLRECPFCGAIPKVVKGFGGIHGMQCECGAIVSFKFSEPREQAITAWNARHEPPNEPLTIEELKQMDGEPVYCVDIYGEGKWALVDTADETCVDSNFDNWGFYCYGWLESDARWLAYKNKRE